MTIQPLMRRQAHRLTFLLVLDAAGFSAFMLIVGNAGLHTERNPLIGAVYASGGVMGVVALKLAAAWLLEARARSCVRPVSRTYARVFLLLSSLAIAGTLVGASCNLAALLDSTVLR